MRRHGLIVLALALGITAAGRDALDDWVARTTLPPVLSETSTEFRDRYGALLRVFPVEDGRMRLALPMAKVDPAFIDMLIAYEDKRFYRHRGVDMLAFLRAAGQAVRHGEIVSGGSTLTMQVARLLENSGTGRLPGKLRQIRVALALERRFSKEEILTLYLQHAPYGGGLEGLRAGTLAWFDKEPRRLNLSEAALLIALPQSPETRRPDRYPEAARDARNRVLARLGYSASSDAPPPGMRSFARAAPHLTDRLKGQTSSKTRFDLTLDAQLQQQIETLAQRAVMDQPRGVSAAIIVADHQTGEVLAHVGSPAYAPRGNGFIDMTAALRSPGSTLKPLIYALAFDQGLAHPETLIDDTPISFGDYAPQNFDGTFRGALTIREALQGSLNIPPVRLTNELGAARLMAGLRRAGTRPVVPGGKPGLAVALGGVGLTLEDLVVLYAGLAQGGRERKLTALLGDQSSLGPRFAARSAAWHITDILAQVAPPPGKAAKAGEIAYKTGTSYGHRDAWAIGYDGRHVVGVWLGRPDGTPVPGAFGGELAAPILFEAFGRIALHRKALPMPPPETLIVGTADLPLPLKRFTARSAHFEDTPNRPAVFFPPNGATLQQTEFGVPLKLRNGVLPLTIMVDGMPVATGLYQREVLLEIDGPGFSRIAVIDAHGHAASVEITLQ